MVKMNKIELEKSPKPIYNFKHASGLDVYFYPKETSNSFYLTLTVKYGSVHTKFKYEDDKKYITIPNGTAHFLEHLTFKMENGEAGDYFSKVGSNSNAYTTFSNTTYEVAGTNNIYDNIDYLINFVLTPFYNKELVEKERGIIIEEALMYEDRPLYKTGRETMKSLFKKCNYRNRVIGEVEDIKKISLEDIKNAYKYFYRPDNMFLTITGNCNPKKLEKLINSNVILNNFKKEKDVEVYKINEPEDVKCEKLDIVENIAKDKVTINKKIPYDKIKHLGEEEYLSLYPSLIMASNFGSTSDYKEEMVNKKIVTYAPWFEIDKLGDYLVITVGAETVKIDEFVNKTLNLLNNLKLSKKEEIRKRNVAISNYIKNFDNIFGMNDFIHTELLETGKIPTKKYTAFHNIDFDVVNEFIKVIKESPTLTVVTRKE